MLIAQLSDIHLAKRGTLAQMVVETRPRLDQVIASLARLSKRPDAILVTGDLADNRHPDAYAEFAELREKFCAPTYLIPGNHDDRALMREAFPDLPGPGYDPIDYTVENFPVRLVALDTQIPGSDLGELDDAQLRWLDARLSEQPDRPSLVFMHHPPFRTYIDEMDAYGLLGREAFVRIIARHKQVKRVLCGHIHRPIQTLIDHALCSVAPGVAFDQVLGLGSNGPKGFYPGSPKYELHQWTGAGFVSHIVTSEDYSTPSIPYPFP